MLSARRREAGAARPGCTVMLRCLKIVDQKLMECGPADGQVFVYISPSEAERRELIDAYKIDEHNLQSSLDPDELARVEEEPDHTALVFKRPKRYSAEDKFHFKIHSVGAFLYDQRLIVIEAEDLPLFDGKAFARIQSLRDLVLKLIYRSVVHFTEHLRVINMISEEIEAQITTSMENRSLIHLFMLEKSLVYYLNAIQANGALIERVRINANNPATRGFSKEHVEFIDDLAIENKQCYEQTRIYSDILAGMMDARASIVNNNLNLMMRTLTILMLAVMWPPLVCGLFSMNVKLPVAQQEGLLPFFMIATAALGPITVGLLWWWRKRRRK
ncbi:MAG TPA: divalent metal ion transporter [Planctomycetes bacterium]|nr:divalent metal ion transporter [Planctomycetota bacterium]